MRRAALLAALLCLPACASYERGSLAAASDRALPLDLRVVARRAEGRACGGLGDPRYRLALEDALQRTDADALVNASWTWENLCIVVRGTAVRLRRP